MEGSTREPESDEPIRDDDESVGGEEIDIDMDDALAAAARVADELDTESETEPLFDESAGEDAAAVPASAAPMVTDDTAAEAPISAEDPNVAPVPPVEAAAAEQEASEEEPVREPANDLAEVPPVPPPTRQPEQPSRRGLAKCAAVLIGTVGALSPVAAGLWVASDPLMRKKKGAGGEAENDGFIPVGSVGAVPDDGSPRKFNVIADKVDAWTIHRDVPIGAVYIRQTPEGKLQAFNAACPHLGCFVNALPDGSFGCPCHDSEFQTDGSIRPVTRTGAKTVALRGLDELEVKLSPDGQTVLVKFQNYLAGLETRKPIP